MNRRALLVYLRMLVTAALVSSGLAVSSKEETVTLAITGMT